MVSKFITALVMVANVVALAVPEAFENVNASAVVVWVDCNVN